MSPAGDENASVAEAPTSRFATIGHDTCRLPQAAGRAFLNWAGMGGESCLLERRVRHRPVRRDGSTNWKIPEAGALRLWLNSVSQRFPVRLGAFRADACPRGRSGNVGIRLANPETIRCMVVDSLRGTRGFALLRRPAYRDSDEVWQTKVIARCSNPQNTNPRAFPTAASLLVAPPQACRHFLRLSASRRSNGLQHVTVGLIPGPSSHRLRRCWSVLAPAVAADDERRNVAPSCRAPSCEPDAECGGGAPSLAK
jgi:hypothetical protein